MQVEIHLQAEIKVQEDTITTKKYGDFPLYLVVNLNNTLNSLKSMKNSDLKRLLDYMLKKMESLKKNFKRSSPTLDAKNYLNVLETLLRSTEIL